MSVRSEGYLKNSVPRAEGGGPSERCALDIVYSLVPPLDPAILLIQLRSVLGPMHEYSMHLYNFSSLLTYYRTTANAENVPRDLR